MHLSKDEMQLKLKYWADIIHECNNSGIKKKDWLLENGISKDQYYYWYRKVKDSCYDLLDNTTAAVPAEISFVELPQPVTDNVTTHVLKTTDNFNTVQTVGARINFNNAVIEINENTSKTFLLNLFEAISYVK